MVVFNRTRRYGGEKEMTCWEWLGHSIYVRYDPGACYRFEQNGTVDYLYPKTPVGVLTVAEMHEILRWRCGNFD